MRTFWENERPSSSEDETETESWVYPEVETKGNIEIVKDLDLSKNELKSEIRKLEHKMKMYRNTLRNQEKIISRLKTDYEALKNKSRLERIQLENKLELLGERYHSFTNCEYFV